MKVKSINRGSHWINSCLFLPLTDCSKTKCFYTVSFSAGSCGHLQTNLYLLFLLFYRLYFPFPFTISELFSSVQFSRSVVSDSLWSHGLQHARLPCLSPAPRAYSNSCPLSRWAHPAISSSVVPFSSCLQSFLAPGSFQMSQFFTSGGQSIGVSASASVVPMHIQDWFPLGWTGWISLQSKGLSRVFSNITVQKHQFFSAQLSLQSNSHPYMITGKTIAFNRQTFVSKITSLLFNMLSNMLINMFNMLVIAFLPRSKHF